MSEAAIGEELQESAARLLEEVRVSPNMTLAMKARLLSSAANTLNSAGRHTGSTLTLTADQIARHPLVRRAGRRVLEVLRPWPDALKAVLAALEADDREA